MHETSLFNYRHNAIVYSSSFFKACATRTDASTAELDRCARSFRAILPAVENVFLTQLSNQVLRESALKFYDWLVVCCVL